MNPASPTSITPRQSSTTRRAPGEPRSLGQMLLDSAADHTGIALQYRRGGQPASISYPELGRAVTQIARGLIGLGIEKGDRISILAATSADWVLADYGALCAGAVVAPIYHTNSPEECAYVLAQSGARLVFCENAAQAAKIARVRERCSELEHVVVFNGAAEGTVTLDDLRRRGADVGPQAVRDRLAQIARGDLATIVYTSGTTGGPKGCMLSHDSLLATTEMYAERLDLNPTHTLYQFLPLAHVLARVAQAVVIRVGARACFWSGDASLIIDELSEYQPTHFPAVPRIYEKIHGTILGGIEDGSKPRRMLFHRALACGMHAREEMRHGRPLRTWEALQFQLADRLVLSKVRALFGTQIQFGLVGAAPVARELLEFFDACGVPVLEGYGLSETCAAATLNTPDTMRLGSVGRALPGTEVSLGSDQEILIRGPHVFAGYYNNAPATEEAVTADGWLRSGDLGQIDGDGFVFITGRKKELIITSSGKNITPVNIESALRETRYITEAVVFGDDRPYLVAMVTLDREEAAKLAERLQIPNDLATIAHDPGVAAEIQNDVDRVNAKLARIEQIKRFAVLDHDLSQATGELTPTLKVKRALVYDRYAGIFAGLYETAAAS